MRKFIETITYHVIFAENTLQAIDKLKSKYHITGLSTENVKVVEKPTNLKTNNKINYNLNKEVFKK